ncbi:NUDIX domain-containing protein [Virgibacillus sp. MSP4-1]|uniref:NUDIX hydrolase n=1 Tax=Virgibacillus sp. MSP4-1 TaxID=2700081 RepID=UPI0006933DDB|nr:NUDIX domain-containing protein [Virgibacillus sp. MSP4-1]QHS22385.1 NUDIX domain-containing protein [Virgibacillus sp. MSP4-1]
MSSNPRPASTVILMNKGKVYLTKRPETMKFLGGYYVFPGGAVERDDEPDEHESFAEFQQQSFSFAHYIAAARELFEEVGVLLAKSGNAELTFKEHSKDDYRSLLVNNRISFREMLKKENFKFDSSALHYFGRRITPQSSPIRFDTRFFIADLPTHQAPSPDWNEIDHAFWSTPEEALNDFEKGTLKLVPPTITSLQTLTHYNNGGPLRMPDNIIE